MYHANLVEETAVLHYFENLLSLRMRDQTHGKRVYLNEVPDEVLSISFNHVIEQGSVTLPHLEKVFSDGFKYLVSTDVKVHSVPPEVCKTSKRRPEKPIFQFQVLQQFLLQQDNSFHLSWAL